ncbi:GcvT family protein [Roseovarius salinarum]|uniref:GcvT family protein n=1 Tax=Roseovarius salinarum TaxID=1981892 RepID=UPI000C32AE22|nr:FAD-dependent oxidoreductase [Roseovarius salinarum]
MTDIPATARVVIIGGGAVGASCLYHLAQAGWRDAVLLERNELTAGSTWHAAGNVPTFSTSWSVMNMQRYSTELYARLAGEVDYPMNYHQTGSVRLAHSDERMQEFAHARSMGRAQGMDLEILTPEEIRACHPFTETHDLKGALYDPNDGDIDPAQLTQALAKGARGMGARIVRFCPALGVRRAGDEWIVETAKGEIRCDCVVNAAGYYARRVGECFKPYGGRTVPMMVMSHQYLLTEEIPELEAWSRDAGRKLPLLRDVDSSYYLRQEKHGLNLGPYERDCRAHWVDPADPMPEDFSFQLYPDDLDRLEWHVSDAVARVPILGQGGVSKVINGPIPYAPDGMPLIGPMPGVPNAFEACVFTFGIAQAGGAGKVLAEWVTEGATEWDMWATDPRRFTDHADRAYCIAKGMEVYGFEYAMHFPWHEWPAGRDRKLSPVHDRVRQLGGVMGAYNGWERANWFAQPGDDTGAAATQTWARSGPWEPRIRAECAAVRDGCGVLDLPGFTRLWVSGAGADDWLRGFVTGKLPAVGRIGLVYVADARGRVLTEFSCVRLAEDSFILITAAAAQWHDGALVRGAVPDGVTVHETTAERDALLVTGPQSRAVLSGLTDADLSLPWLSHQHAKVAGQKAFLIRVSFAGELGWEVHAENAAIPAIHEAVLGAGARPFGMYALNSLRLEKGYRTWKGDLSTDYTMLEAGLERFVDFDKPQDYPGKAALLAERARGREKALVPLVVEAGAADAPCMAPVRHGGAIVGTVTSGAWGYRVGASLALAMIRAELAVAGTEVEVEIYGERRPAVVQSEGPVWDPGNERLRA